jgi:Flp pilus assembly protein TadD
VAVALRPKSPGAVLLLARLLSNNGRADEADAYFREALRLQPGYATIYNNRGVAFFLQGRLDDAIASFREEIRLKRLTQEVGLGVALNNLGQVLLRKGDLDEAITAFREAARVEPDYGGWHSALAEALSAKGRLDEAIAEFREAARLTKDVESPEYASLQANLGLILLQQKNYPEAEKVLRECLAIREKKEPDGWATFDSRSQLGGALLGQQKYAEAEPLLLQGYEGMKQREATIPPPGKVRLPEALERLVQLYDALGEKDTADQWRGKLQAEQARQAGQ